MSNLVKVILIGMIVILFVGLGSAALFLNSIKETNRMDVTHSSIDAKVAIPPIDLSAPTKTETATFALG